MRENFQFRPGTCDENVFTNVADKNEYRLPDRFTDGALVIDIGAHIGSFTQACIDRGASKVIAFEPEIENFNAFRRHLEPEMRDGRVQVFPLAVAQSGISFREHSGHITINGELNTGGGFLFGRSGQSYVPEEYVTGVRFLTATVGLDDILEGMLIQDVDLMKMDAEYSEWSILHDSKLLNRFRGVCGEYHSFAHLNKEYLQMFLEGLGFRVEIKPHEGSELGLFWGYRE